MRQRERYKRLLIFAASAIIMLLQTGIFIYTWFSSYSEIGANYFVRGNYIIIAQYALMMFFAYKIYGGFKIGQLRIFEMLYSQILSVLTVNIITYLQLSLIGRWQFMSNIAPIALMTLVDIVVVTGYVLLTRWIYVKLYPPRKLLVIYGKYSPDGLIKKLDGRADKYNVEETVSIDNDIEYIKKKISEHQNIMLADIPADLRNELLKFCFANDIRCYSVPKISDIMIKSSQEINLFDTALLLFRPAELRPEQQFFKRAFDIIFSLLFIVLFSPLMLVIACIIKLYDKGPVLFTQDRLTKGGKVFKLYKFRSMSVQKDNEETEYCMTRKCDSRVTPVGKILRKLHLDELPQLLNVLKGEMSLVGPRPECPKIAKQYTKIVPEFEFRLKVKAGLTGFAQVFGKYNTTPCDKLKLDLEYIKNYSFLLDLKLIILTLKVLLSKENTEGVEDWQLTAATKENLQDLENLSDSERDSVDAITGDSHE